MKPEGDLVRVELDRYIDLSNLDTLKNGNYNWSTSKGRLLPFKYGDIVGEIKIIDYIDPHNITILFENKTHTLSPNKLKKCQLGKILNKVTKDFKIEIGQTFKDDKRDLTIIDREYRGRYKYYKYKCNKCGFDCREHWNIKDKKYKDELWVEESNLLSGKGCSCCSGKIVVKGINDIATIEPKLVKYFTNIKEAYIYTYSSNKKVICRCPNCGFEKKIIINDLHRQGFSCPQCSDSVSYPNRFMFNILRQLNIDFETEYSPEWINPKRYDFYIPSMKLIIEMDGAWHKIDNNLSGQTAKQSKEIDNYKDKLAEQHGLKVIRIDCDYKTANKFNYIKTKILNSKLNEIFDFNNIDWDNILVKLNDSIVREICLYWENNNGLTIKDLSNIFNISTVTISKYLRLGTKLKWCNYDPVKAKSIFSHINGKKRGIKIKVFKDNKYLGIFNNSCELEEQSEKLFGVKLYNTGIRAVCNGKLKHYKGYTFEDVI